MKYLIRSISFDIDGGVAVDYMDVMGDLRANGLVINHVLYVPAEDQYDDEIDALQSAAQELLADALDDLGRLPPLVPEPPSDDDDDEDDE